MRDEFLWVEKYRPKTIEDCILPEQTKKTFLDFLDKGEIPNMLLSGPAGCGKTTVAKALCNQLGLMYMSLMGRMKAGFLTLLGITPRTSRLQSLSLLRQSIKSSSLMKQTIPLPTYNSFLERVLRSSPTTADSFSRVITRIKSLNPHSRCAVVDFSIKGRQNKKLQQHSVGRLVTILEQERIEADKKVLAQLINNHFPDWRRVLNECQRYSVSGKIDSGILATFSDVSVNDLTKNLKQKNFTEVRKWCVDNLDNDSSVLLRRIYDSLSSTLVSSSIPAAVLILAKYQYQVAFVADQEINMLACLTEIMVECEFNETTYKTRR